MRVAITLACDQCKRRNYRTNKNKKQTDRLSLKKYCKFCHQHTLHKETR
ncbi:MAG: 50S ribosomal protein L33 [Firmicutes bacterium]|nr:50S ribosomal protein L33 [Bacillota bacterium]HQD39184.1 50S ribosomal protein L33 [Bacillota bacterium]